jgi:hypothetical protein
MRDDGNVRFYSVEKLLPPPEAISPASEHVS